MKLQTGVDGKTARLISNLRSYKVPTSTMNGHVMSSARYPFCYRKVRGRYRSVDADLPLGHHPDEILLQ